MASQVAVLSAAMAPAWDAFFAERVVWPFVALLLCSLLVRALKPIYNSARRSSRSFRYFLFVYVGTPDRQSVSSPYLVAVVLGLRAVLSVVVTTISIWRTSGGGSESESE
ncbi:hypothetical protein AK812_SmicGene41978 [Symbiodinium microadriaticum]|uniref:Uncharacterized protein n=1 Tax=Symbiodinium microadriaticum TaxID=2951 RepID=A0A1Q9C4R2_SYMMI|nr:hypothetical protein AK812_SmicGene41978 [Symbiodinium microadriaticum]